MTPLSDLDKTLICMRLVVDLARHSNGIDTKAFEEALRRSLGSGWSLVSALQWLTGKRARKVVTSLPADFKHAGLSKVELMQLHTVAVETLSMAPRKQ